MKRLKARDLEGRMRFYVECEHGYACGACNREVPANNATQAAHILGDEGWRVFDGVLLCPQCSGATPKESK